MASFGTILEENWGWMVGKLKAACTCHAGYVPTFTGPTI